MKLGEHLYDKAMMVTLWRNDASEVQDYWHFLRNYQEVGLRPDRHSLAKLQGLLPWKPGSTSGWFTTCLVTHQLRMVGSAKTMREVTAVPSS